MTGLAITLSEAARTLELRAGRHFSASRVGGEQRFATILCEQHGLCEQDARLVIERLARRHVIDWIAEPSLSQPCPGLLELFGDWTIQPERVA